MTVRLTDGGRSGDLTAPCEACAHPQRHLIDQMMSNGQPDHVIVQIYNIPQQSLFTHRWEHVPLSMASALADPKGVLVLAQIALQKIQYWEDLCEATGVRAAGRGAKLAELRFRHIDTIVKLMEKESSHRIAHDWERIKRVLLQVFAKFPEARAEFEHLLSESGEPDAILTEKV